MGIFRKMVLVAILLLVFFNLHAQSIGRVSGRVTDTLGRPIDLVNVVIKTQPQKGTTTNEKGFFSIDLPAGKEVILLFSNIGYASQEVKLWVVPGKMKPLSIRMLPTAHQLQAVTTMGERYVLNTGVEHMDSKMITSIPAMSSGVEGLIKAGGLGVHSNNELSAQYNVRGGSYDENLVYVNGIEVFRPFLIRSGQQEGLSFINPDMVSSVRFSSGGFASQYGDKTASVLDVDYAEPVHTSGSLSGSFLGASAHLGGISKDKKFSYLAGARYQSNAYMLKQMQTHGNYQPNFTDVQTLLRYRPNEKWKFSLFGNYARNEYRLIPETGEATIGNILQNIQRLNIYYDGQEVDAYQTLFGSFNATYQYNRFSEITFSSTYFRSLEKETFDINAEYWLSDINMDMGSEEMGESISSRAVGGELHHGRNFLNANIFNEEIRGKHLLGSHELRWGLAYRKEFIHDQLEEWYMYDSSYYTLPHAYTSPGDTVSFTDSSRLLTASSYLYAVNSVENSRVSAFLQDKWEFGLNRLRYTLTYGLRASYATYYSEFFCTPRLRFAAQPFSNKNISFYMATGLYYQPPFYKEMRNTKGQLNCDIRSQKSWHFILGGDYLFRWGERPFKLSGEMYYKYLWDLVSYELDNVRIIYSGTNDADGFALGADVKLSGEIVQGLESWLAISLLKTMEDIDGDGHAYIPRPTDQRFSINLFFQDEIPNHPDFKAHLNLVYATPLPYGIIGQPQYLRAQRRGKAYFRTDVGFSWKFLHADAFHMKPFSMLKAGYLSLEILNMFNYYNIISYSTVTDIDGNSYLTPNYLTPRLYNVKLRFEF